MPKRPKNYKKRENFHGIKVFKVVKFSKTLFYRFLVKQVFDSIHTNGIEPFR